MKDRKRIGWEAPETDIGTGEVLVKYLWIVVTNFDPLNIKKVVRNAWLDGSVG